MSLASGGSSGTRSTRGSVITDRKSLSRRYSAVLRVYTWPTRVCCCWGGRAFAIARTCQCLVAHAVRLTLRGRATHEYSTERIHSALGLGCPWPLVLCVHHTTRITIVISLPGRFRPKSGMERLRRSLTSAACVHLSVARRRTRGAFRPRLPNNEVQTCMEFLSNGTEKLN